MKKYKILLADDHQLFREGVEMIVSEIENCSVVGSLKDGVQVIHFLDSNDLPDLLLMDLQMPNLDGKTTLEEVRRRFSALKVIIISMYNNPTIVRSLINSGANGYLLKNADKVEFKLAIEKVFEGGRYFSSEVTESLAFQSSDENPDIKNILSERELEIVLLIAQGMSSQQVADKLFISVRTVETHRKNILSKLNLNNVAGLIRLAFQQGLIS